MLNMAPPLQKFCNRMIKNNSLFQKATFIISAKILNPNRNPAKGSNSHFIRSIKKSMHRVTLPSSNPYYFNQLSKCR